MLNMVRETVVVILLIPPHCSHRLQPLYIASMELFSTDYNSEVDKWLKNHPGRTVTVLQIAQLLTPANLKSTIALTAANGFHKTGIWQLNKAILEKYDFAHAELTDCPDPQGKSTARETSGKSEIVAEIAETLVSSETSSGQPDVGETDGHGGREECPGDAVLHCISRTFHSSSLPIN